MDEAVQQALDFARKDGNTTLVILTADHAHSSQIIENDAEAPGLTQILLTADNAPMTLNYGNSEKRFQRHTGAQSHIAASGPQAANIVGLTDQTDLFYIIGDALRLLNKE